MQVGDFSSCVRFNMPTISRTNQLLLEPSRKQLYDERQLSSILNYAVKLQGKTFEDILVENGLSEADINYLRAQSMSNKGLLGNLIEQAYFGFPSNSRQEADFAEIGVELKSTPYEVTNNEIRPGETLSLTQINYRIPQEPDFYKSHVWEKLQKILIVYYQREKKKAEQIRSKLFYSIGYVFMLKPDERDKAIIEADYKLLVGYMFRGEAHFLSRTHGEYLGVAPKSSRREFIEQYYEYQGKHELALKRGFVLKTAYLTHILKRASGIADDPGETIITNISALKEMSFANLLEKKVSPYIGMDKQLIWEMTKRPNEKSLSSAKNNEAILTCRMLGVKHNRVAEFVKAGIIPKVVSFTKEKSKNQQFRLDDINFMELFNEEPDFPNDEYDDNERHGWEASKLFSALADRQYLLMVFWETDKGTIFKGCQLWGISDSDLETVHQAWSKTKRILNEGVDLVPHQNKTGKTYVTNNLPGISDNGVFHIRPHATKSYHVINGVPYGSGNIKDSDLLPNGDRITKQAYWLNRQFIESQLRPDLVMQY